MRVRTVLTIVVALALTLGLAGPASAYTYTNAPANGPASLAHIVMPQISASDDQLGAPGTMTVPGGVTNVVRRFPNYSGVEYVVEHFYLLRGTECPSRVGTCSYTPTNHQDANWVVQDQKVSSTVALAVNRQAQFGTRSFTVPTGYSDSCWFVSIVIVWENAAHVFVGKRTIFFNQQADYTYSGLFASPDQTVDGVWGAQFL